MSEPYSVGICFDGNLGLDEITGILHAVRTIAGKGFKAASVLDNCKVVKVASREEAHSVVEKYVLPEKQKAVRKDVNTAFRSEEMVPYGTLCDIIVVKHAKDLKPYDLQQPAT